MTKFMATGPQKDHVIEILESEGFDYAFVGYSNFEDVIDSDFHNLRKAFLAARKELFDYLQCEDYNIDG